MKDVNLSDAQAWAASVPGLEAKLKAEAEERDDPIMGDSAHWYKCLVRIAYADYLRQELSNPGQDSLLFPADESEAPSIPEGKNPFLELMEEPDDER